MKYKLKKNYTTDPEAALEEILMDRGVTDIENFVNPSSVCELNPYLLKNIESAANRLLYHLRKGSSILFNVD